jgi:hypothetical protein
MHKYRVVDLLANESCVVLRCQSGRHHFARVLGVLPPANALLQGNKPHLGFGVLICLLSRSMFRMIFESINQAASAASPGAVQSSPAAQAPARRTDGPSSNT